MCDIINVPSGSPLQALLRDNAGTINQSLSTSAVHLHGSAAGRLLKSGLTDDELLPHGPTDDALLPQRHCFPTKKATVNTM